MFDRVLNTPLYCSRALLTADIRVHWLYHIGKVLGFEITSYLDSRYRKNIMLLSHATHNYFSTKILDKSWKNVPIDKIVVKWISVKQYYIYFNSFWNNFLFLYPLKTSENQSFSDFFRGYRNGALKLKWVKWQDQSYS